MAEGLPTVLQSYWKYDCLLYCNPKRSRIAYFIASATLLAIGLLTVLQSSLAVGLPTVLQPY